jgi:hypothetical protein
MSSTIAIRRPESQLNRCRVSQNRPLFVFSGTLPNLERRRNLAASARLTTLFAWPEASVIGTEGAAIVKPVPATARPAIVIDPVPVDVSVIVCVEIEFSDTVPKFRLVELTVN